MMRKYKKITLNVSTIVLFIVFKLLNYIRMRIVEKHYER